MAEDSANSTPSAPERAALSPIRKCIMAAVAAMVVCTGLWGLMQAVTGPSLEWRTLALAAAAAAFSPLYIEFRRAGHGNAIRVPLGHAVYFASALALGPGGAALPAAVGTSCRLAADHGERKPLHQALYMILKPAAVCVAAALAYAAAGGSALRPQSVDSLGSVFCAAAVYVAAHVVLHGTVGAVGRHAVPQAARASRVVAAWSACLIGGYLIAVLYACSPGYILLAPALGAGLAYLGLAGRKHKDAARVVQVFPTEHDTGSGESGRFVDRATGLANHRYLTMFLDREVSRSQRAGKPLSVAVFDLDDLKRPADDADDKTLAAALAEMADRLKSGLRDYDLVARHSSGRLLVVLPETGVDQALEIAQRLHDSATSLKVAGKAASVSVGIATSPMDGSSGEELINSAHHALNRGKFAGANQVHTCCEIAEAS